MYYYIKKIIISLLCWHIFIFYLRIIILNNEYNESTFCICDSNIFTNTLYMCTTNMFSKYFTYFIPINALEPSIIDPYTYISPLKITYSNMVCAKRHKYY